MKCFQRNTGLKTELVAGTINEGVYQATVSSKGEDQMKFNSKHLVVALTLVVVLGALAALPLLAQTGSKTPPPAQEVLSAALKTAKAENKTVMVDFAASW